MAEQQIRFDDGAVYERMMGVWSRLAGEVFLDWLAPGKGLKWADIGCGNGAFTELIVERCAPSQVQGIDPSEGQLAFARTRPSARLATFQIGDAMQLPFADCSVDCSVMALVIFFVPTPARGVAEMARVTAPGGSVSAYVWDILGGGFPLAAIQAEMRAIGLTPTLPPSAGAARLDALQGLWAEAGLVDVETAEISVQRTFVDFEEYWAISLSAPLIGSAVASLPPDQAQRLKKAVHARLPAADASGRVTLDARANAIKGRVPAK